MHTLLVPDLLAVGVGLLTFAGRLGIPSLGKPKVQARPLMTRIERETIAYIEAAVPHARVHAQVSMDALLKPLSGLDRKERASTRNRYCQKRVDYVIEDRRDGKVLALVELDDRTHNQASDAARDTITRTAGYLTIRLPATERPTIVTVAQRMGAALATRSPPPEHAAGAPIPRAATGSPDRRRCPAPATGR